VGEHFDLTGATPPLLWKDVAGMMDMKALMTRSYGYETNTESFPFYRKVGNNLSTLPTEKKREHTRYQQHVDTTENPSSQADLTIVNQKSQ
jgi:hypothetical protein